MRRIENLVFKGGGVLGIAYAGAISVLEDKGILKDVKRAAGTSVGSIVSALVCLGYSSEEIREVMDKTDFNKFLDHANPLLIPKKYGIYSGDFLFKWIQDLVEKKTGDKNITFEGLKKDGFKDLRVVSTNLSTADIQEFSWHKTPETIVAESIRSSMSIPMVFTAWKFSNEKPNDHVYVDGGVLSNFPISSFQDMDKTLGFFIKTHVEDEVLDYDNIAKYAKYLFKATMRGQDLDFFNDPEKSKVTVNIDSMGISSVEFDLDKSQQMSLFNSGKIATIEFLEKEQKDSSFWKSWT